VKDAATCAKNNTKMLLAALQITSKSGNETAQEIAFEQ
jgi:hypothetical protein